MAASGFTPISLYFSATGAAVPIAANLVAGELALNTNDGKLYYKNSSGVVTLLAGATAGPAGGSTTQVQYNNAGVLAGITGATTNGTALTLVAPVLGTPASGVVTNLTGTASININGTVGATTANTGAFTTITASLSINGSSGVLTTNVNAGTGAAAAFLANNGTHQSQFGTFGTGYTTGGALTANSAYVYNSSGAGVAIVADSGGTVRIGAGSTATVATFTSAGINGVLGGTTTAAASVTTLGASGKFTSTVASGKFIEDVSGTTSNLYAEIRNTTGWLITGVESSAGGSLITGGSAYAGIIATNSASNFEIGVNGTKVATFTSAGFNGVVGGSTPAAASVTTLAASTSVSAKNEGSASVLSGIILSNAANSYGSNWQFDTSGNANFWGFDFGGLGWNKVLSIGKAGGLTITGTLAYGTGTTTTVGLRFNSGFTNYASIYPENVTPGATNYTLISKYDSTLVYLNSLNTVSLTIGATPIVTALSTGASITGTLSATGAASFIQETGFPVTVGGNVTTASSPAIQMKAGSTKKGLLFGYNYNVTDAWEITLSTAAGGSTYTTPIIQGTAAGVTIPGTLGAGATSVTTLTASSTTRLGGATASAILNIKDGGYRLGTILSRAGDVSRVYDYLGDGTNGTTSDERYTDLINTSWHIRGGAAGTTALVDITSTGLSVTGSLSCTTGLDARVATTGDGSSYLARNNSINLIGKIIGSTNAQFGTETAHDLLLLRGNSEKARVTSTGLSVTGTTSSTSRLAVGDTGTSDALTSYTSTGGSLYMGLDNSAGSALGTAGAYGTAIYRPASTGFAISRAGTVDLSISSAGVVTIPGKTIVNAALDVNPAFGLGVYVSPATDANGTASVLRLYGGANQFTNRYVEISCYNNGGSNVNEMVFKVGNVGTIFEAMHINYVGDVTMGRYGVGTATFNSAGTISSVSDETWKTKDGIPTDPDLMLKKLEPGYWYYNDEKKKTFGKERQLGFYAQNVNAAIGPEAAPEPETVTTKNEDGTETSFTKPWGYYDRSVLAVVVMSLQKALLAVEQLTAKVAALETK